MAVQTYLLYLKNQLAFVVLTAAASVWGSWRHTAPPGR